MIWMISGLDLNQKTINDQGAPTVCLYIIYFLCESCGLEVGGEADLILTELDPVGSTVRYEMMKLCTGSV